jgi:molybdate transport system regulatory protein
MTDRWEARVRWRLERGPEIALGPGKADLLEAIDRAGSISGAARVLGMSYRRAWLLADTMNRCFVRPLVVTSPWRGKGASLSEIGREALALYRKMEADSRRAAGTALGRLRSLLRPAPRRHPPGRRPGRDRPRGRR